MIFAHDRGRMCNNLLQFAHVYAWAREHGRKAVSIRFAYKYPYFHICHTAGHNFITYVLAKYSARLELLPVVTFDEPQDTDDSEKIRFIEQHKNVLVEGWYVRFYDLFLKHKDEIRRLFAFDETVEKAVSTRIQCDKSTVKIGVHVRRGDYATWLGGKYLYTDRQYISNVSRAAEFFPGKKIRVYICGNDPTLDRKAYEEAFGEDNVVFPDGTPGEDLCLLSHMNYLIGAPSTFTLVASMYRDLPLYWIEEAEKKFTINDFDTFNNLFRRIK